MGHHHRRDCCCEPRRDHCCEPRGCGIGGFSGSWIWIIVVILVLCNNRKGFCDIDIF